MLGLRTALENREARPSRYKTLESHGNRRPASVSMIISGVLVLIFLIVHLVDFRFAEEDPRGFSYMVVERLSTPLGATIYFLGVGALGFHLLHAFQSLFQTLGLHHPRWKPLIDATGVGLAALLAILFWLFPTVCLLKPERWEFFGSEATTEAPVEAGEAQGGGE